MNTLTKSLVAFTFLSGPFVSVVPSQAQSATLLPTPAPAQSALTALLADSTSPLPTGTRLLSVRVSDGLATADFSRELRDNFTGGDSAETRAVNSILRTLGQYPTVSQVQILVEGKPIDSLGGLLVLTNPLPVIRPATQTATGQPRLLHRHFVLIFGHGKVTQKRFMPTADTR